MCKCNCYEAEEASTTEKNENLQFFRVWYHKLEYIYSSVLWIREFDWLHYRLLSADSQQLRIIAHRASRLNLTVLFYVLLDIFSFLCNETTVNLS